MRTVGNFLSLLDRANSLAKESKDPTLKEVLSAKVDEITKKLLDVSPDFFNFSHGSQLTNQEDALYDELESSM